MGSSFSSSSSSSAAAAGRPPTAKVINAEGSLIEYSQPVQVSDVLGLEHRTFVLCDADELFYGHHIQALDSKHLIELGKLYFFLPAKRLDYPLTASEIAALAVSANSAFAAAAAAALKRKKKRSSGRKRNRKGVHVMPFYSAMESDAYESFNEKSVGSWRTERVGRKSDEIKQRALSGTEVTVKRAFRPRLGSIEEVYE